MVNWLLQEYSVSPKFNGVINGGYSKVVISWDGLGLSKSEYSEPEEIITYDMVLNEKRKLEERI